MSTIDWERVHERLARSRRALADGGDPQDARAELERRALELARPLAVAAAPGETLDLVVISLAGARYGIDAHRVAEVLELGEPTRVPCTPAVLLGVVNHRGRVLPVFDLARLLTAVPAERHAWVVAVEVEALTFGIAAESVEETIELGASAFAPAPAGPVRGVTADRLTILDLDALAVDPRLHIDDSELQ